MTRFRNKTINGRLYDLSHLDPFTFPVTHKQITRIVRVTFEDHVFTEAHNPHAHAPDLIYSRRPGDWRAFNVRRRELSYDLPVLFRNLGSQSVYRSKGQNFVFLRSKVGQAPYVVFFQALQSSRQKCRCSCHRAISIREAIHDKVGKPCPFSEAG